ncbi:MAG: hypothetical protein IPG10_16110 [Flavobacteriales bacterium]|nr:hypothetical protein [Flavobacteriales bacterium]
MNEGLANKRDKAAMRWMQSELGKNKLAKGDSLFTGVSHGEDWTGFERELNASNFADKGCGAARALHVPRCEQARERDQEHGRDLHRAP